MANRVPSLIAHFDELEQHQEKPISISSVGAGKVVITHMMGLWLPWVVNTSETKIVIGLGENMPVNLLVGLIATQCNINIGNLT